MNAARPHLHCLRRWFVLALTAITVFAVWAAPAHANRMGPPWMSTVTADQTTLYASADKTDPVGPLSKGAMLVVIGESQT